MRAWKAEGTSAFSADPMSLKISLLLLAVCALHLRAEPREFPKHNFAIEHPKGWTEILPLPPVAVFAWTNSDQSSTIVGVATKLNPKDLLDGPKDFIAGARDGMTDKGAKLSPNQKVTLANRPFVLFTGKMGEAGANTFCCRRNRRGERAARAPSYLSGSRY